MSSKVSPLPVSVIILTKNEALNLPPLFASITWCDDIHVVDSGSEDETLPMSKKAGAQTYSHPFSGFGAQRNWALENCRLRHEWVLFLDADEVTPPGFVHALDDAVRSADSSVAGYYCCWKMMVEDVWLKRCDHFPKWQLRLLRRGKLQFIDYGHGQKEDVVTGALLYLKEPYEHHALRKGWADWVERHNRYSTKEASERLAVEIDWKGVLSAEGPRRNRALKTWVSRVPGWPLARFLITYFFRLGFLEGRVGLLYCINLAYYEFLIQIKMSELKRTSRPTGNK
jgi:glycosyltransferase involved in cell wall biosynthesis